MEALSCSAAAAIVDTLSAVLCAALLAVPASRDERPANPLSLSAFSASKATAAATVERTVFTASPKSLMPCRTSLPRAPASVTSAR